MNFSLIICTYMRDEALLQLLQSVKEQTCYPNEIIIIDGSTNDKTKQVLKQNYFENLKYHKVKATERGLTKQRNYGINLVAQSSDIICFLDDDIVLTPYYFKNLIETYRNYPDALAVGGYIINEVDWKQGKETKNINKFYFDGWLRSEPSRFKLRRKFGLAPDTPPAFLPTFAHGRSVGFLPPSGKTYKVEQIMGGVASYKKDIFKALTFSTYFEGYGLYEDTDFSLRLAKRGNLYVNTSAQLSHFHDNSGRPNKYKYGKMVVRNGWYVWRVKYANPSFKSRVKWNLTVLLLTTVRFTNIVTTKQKKEAFTETLGRVVGWLSLLFNSPKLRS
ncbi:glycosyltransferase family 2 protein [Algibacter sp. AS12]|uniref:glycosyltransferase family 2 protein n=1 Tax=Algibacter sp. AS12 TaxID=3135773 RepID=UPI00398B8236